MNTDKTRIAPLTKQLRLPLRLQEKSVQEHTSGISPTDSYCIGVLLNNILSVSLWLRRISAHWGNPSLSVFIRGQAFLT
jgi:hypothetical protein